MLWVFATLLPLLAFVVQILAGARLGKAGSLVATAAIGGAFALSTLGIANYAMFQKPESLLPAHHGRDDLGHDKGHAEPHGSEKAHDPKAHDAPKPTLSIQQKLPTAPNAVKPVPERKTDAGPPSAPSATVPGKPETPKPAPAPISAKPAKAGGPNAEPAVATATPEPYMLEPVTPEPTGLVGDAPKAGSAGHDHHHAPALPPMPASRRIGQSVSLTTLIDRQVTKENAEREAKRQAAIAAGATGRRANIPVRGKSEAERAEELISAPRLEADRARAAWYQEELKSIASPVIERGGIVIANIGGVDGHGEIRLGYKIDNVTVLMFFMVSLIATCIHVFAMGYMAEEIRYHRFFAFLSLFCFSMFALVISDNFLQIFICWELVGVCSYFLIGHYYERQSASCAANKAFITNRVGDVGFIIGLMVMFSYFGTFDMDEVFSILRNPDGSWKPWSQIPVSPFWLTVAGLGVFIGSVGKSAQFPLHVWLPDAMEGPTPVSALVHSATMVAAGVYLTARSLPMMTNEALLVITYSGAITLFVAATIAIVATDIKKALAYSTISQLGYMMFALGIGGYVAGLMHLVTHAFFKSLLFLCSGSVIYGCHHVQEMPRMGGLFRKMPITAITMGIGVLAICGAPLTSGFYSKDAIIAQVLAYGSKYPGHALIMLLPIMTAGITAFYMCRMWFLTFTGEPRDEHLHDHAHEPPRIMTTPLLILSVMALIGAGLPGFNALERFLEFGKPVALNTGMPGAVTHTAHELHGIATVVASLVAGIGILLAAGMYYWNMISAEEGRRHFPAIHALLVNKWYFDEIYRHLLVRPSLAIARAIAWTDRNVVDRTVETAASATYAAARTSGRLDINIVDGLVNQVAQVTGSLASALRTTQTGWLRGYVLYLAAGTAGLIALGATLYR